MQGFKIEASDAMQIIDKFNETANNMPIDSAGIGEALQRSAASFHAANTDLSESIALITGAKLFGSYCRNVINRIFLIAENSLEFYTTISKKLRYEGLTT